MPEGTLEQLQAPFGDRFSASAWREPLRRFSGVLRRFRAMLRRFGGLLRRFVVGSEDMDEFGRLLTPSLPLPPTLERGSEEPKEERWAPCQCACRLS